MKNNWFHKLLVSYLPAFVIICLSMLLMSYLSLMEMSKKSTEQAHTALVQNVNKLIDQRLESVNSLMNYEIKNNVAINNFYDDAFKSDRYYTDVQAAVAVKKLLNDNPFIESIYLFRVPDQMVLSPSKLVNLDQFDDKGYIGATLNSRTAYSWKPRTVKTSVEANGNADIAERRVVSLAKNTNLKNYSFMIVNVNINQVSELLYSMIDKDTTFIHLIDPEGKVIVSTDPSQQYNSSPSGGKIIASAKSAYTGWLVSSGSKVGGIVAFVSSLFYLWMVLSFMIMLAGLIWIIYVSRRNYRPIKTIMERISVLPGSKETETKRSNADIDEFQYIETTIDSLMQESSSLQEKYKETSLFRKKHILLSMLGLEQGNGITKWEEELKLLGLRWTKHGAVAAIVEIDQYSRFIKEYKNDHHLLKFVLSNVAREVAESKGFSVWSEWIDQSRMVILYFLAGNEGEESALKDNCELLRDWVAQNLDFTITIGIGPLAQHIEQIQSSFRKAAVIVGYKSSLGINQVIMAAQVINRPKGELFKQLQCIRSTSQLFRAGDSQWELHFQEMYEDLKLQLYAYDDLTSLMQVLISHLQKELSELPEELYAIWRDEAYQNLIKELEQNETLDEIFAAFKAIMQNSLLKMNEIRENKTSHQMVMNIKQYITDNFHNPDLSLTHLNEAFGLNAKYLSRLFRESFGVKFLEYVTSYRIEKAQQLLVETDKTIQDIGQEVGYEQSLTFIRVFKKQTGETPGQYRKMKMNK
ncbi:AraC family transcriptional regulator [Paenibacillus agaridevorans]|uniref:AraC family transcriptional regulator n=1 Tax=Paenibacillus agaridevorans TaxID=171404 RepID=UPI001BE47451|nr:AraC family transcriptional regulator [Paenibacillus agaridevorans]